MYVCMCVYIHAYISYVEVRPLKFEERQHRFLPASESRYSLSLHSIDYRRVTAHFESRGKDRHSSIIK